MISVHSNPIRVWCGYCGTEVTELEQGQSCPKCEQIVNLRHVSLTPWSPFALRAWRLVSEAGASIVLAVRAVLHAQQQED